MADDAQQVDRKFLDLYSRQIGTYGMDTMVRLISIKVLILGCKGVGAEAAKNLALAGVHSVSLFDPSVIVESDLGSNFCFSLDNVGTTTRGDATAKFVTQLNPNTRVRNVEALTDEIVQMHDVVVVTSGYGNLSHTELVRLNELCRKHSPVISFIFAFNASAIASVFVDHGSQFKTKDPDGRAALQKSVTEVVHRVDKQGRSYTRLRLATPEGMQPGALRDRTEISFSEVRGMINQDGQSINDKKEPFDAVHAFADAANTIRIYPSLPDQGYSEYESGGFVHEKKETVVRDFRSLEQCLVSPPETIITDSMMDGSAENFVHLFVAATLKFVEAKGELPELGNTNHAAELIALAKQFNEAGQQRKESFVPPTVEAPVVENDELPVPLPPAAAPAPFAADAVDFDMMQRVAVASRAQLQPLCTILGAIVAQEVVKITGKYTPIYQHLHLNLMRVLPEQTFPIPSENRYRDHQVLFGKEFVEKLQDLKMFMVGCGALGCENLKNFALSGICCGRGLLTVTDNDRIEVSNLNRQFLFREENVGQPKSVAAANRASSMNPALKVSAQQDLVSDSTEHIFTDGFWRGLDVVTNALDNMKARLYVDEQCVLHEKILVEAGTMGTGGNVDIVVPHKTTSYSDGGGADETGGIPMCTLRNFPYIFDHCIEWARAQFDDLFVSPILMTEQLRDNPTGFVSKLRSEVQSQESAGAKRSILAKHVKNLETLLKVVEVMASSNIELDTCANLAWVAFHSQFRDRIASLIRSFPADAKKRNGEKFWSGQRKFPTVMTADLSDADVNDFLIAATNLYACMFKLHGEKHPPVQNDPAQRWHAECRTPEFLKQMFASRELPPETISAVDDLDEESSGVAVSDDDAVERRFEELLVAVEAKAATMAPAQSLDFEKDDDDNFHIDFVAAAANLRARNYDIATKDRLSVKLVAGKIIPAIATTTAAVTGFALLELFKVLQDKDVGELRNGMLDLGSNVYTMFDRDPPTKIKTEVIKTYMPEQDYTDERTVVAFPDPHTKYDKLWIDVTRTTTVSEFVDALQALTESVGGYEVVTIGVGKGMIWNGLPNHANFGKPLLEVIAQAIAPDHEGDFWAGKLIFHRLSVNLENPDGDEVLPATIVLRLPQ